MGIFDLEDWRSLWNLGKPDRAPSGHSSSNTRLNQSHGDLSRRYMARKNQSDEVDSRTHHSLDRQVSASSGKRGGSAPPPTNRRGLNQAPPKVQNVRNGMVEPLSQKDPVRMILPMSNRNTPLTVEARTNSSESSPNFSESGKSNDPVSESFTRRLRPESKGKTNSPNNDSSWIKSRHELDSSIEFVDNNKSASSPVTSQRYATKEPTKSWMKNLNRKSTENLSNRYANPARSSSRDLSNSDDQPTTFNEAKLKFQQLAQAASARQTQSYNEPLRVKYNSQQNITGHSKAPWKQYQSAVGLDVYDYPNKNPEVQKRASLYDRANSSGLPEPARVNTSREVQPARPAPLTTASNATHRSGRNIALLGLSSDNSEAETPEALVTSTPRSSTRVTKSRRNSADPDWDTLDITLKRSSKKSEGLGFTIRGGVGEEVRPGDSQIYVSNIAPGENAALDGRLRVGDIIIAVNGNSMQSISHKKAIQMLSAARSSVRLTVKRFVGKVHIMLVTLQRNGQSLGLTITGGVGNEVPGGGTAIYVKNIIPGGVADKTGGIEVGDQIQKVNNTPLIEISHHYATQCLKTAGDTVALLIAKTGRINPLIFAE